MTRGFASCLVEAGTDSIGDRSSLRAKNPRLIGTALSGALRRVVWDPGATPGDPIRLSYLRSAAVEVWLIPSSLNA